MAEMRLFQQMNQYLQTKLMSWYSTYWTNIKAIKNIKAENLDSFDHNCVLSLIEEETPGIADSFIGGLILHNF